jgi:hypothetical protein
MQRLGKIAALINRHNGVCCRKNESMHHTLESSQGYFKPPNRNKEHFAYLIQEFIKHLKKDTFRGKYGISDVYPPITDTTIDSRPHVDYPVVVNGILGKITTVGNFPDIVSIITPPSLDDMFINFLKKHMLN